MNWLDIALHTVPTILVGALMGFMAGFGLTMGGLLGVVFIIAGTIGTLAFSFMWTPREWRQHGGSMGGRQSWAEALIPLAAGPVAFALSTLAFWRWPL